MRFATLIEETVSLEDVATALSTDAISLNFADKFSVQVVATTGDSIAHLEVSNDNENWDELDIASIAEGACHTFEQANCSSLSTRITLENDDIVNVSADCKFLVIGDAI